MLQETVCTFTNTPTSLTQKLHIFELFTHDAGKIFEAERSRQRVDKV